MAASWDCKLPAEQIRKTCSFIDHIAVSDSYFVATNNISETMVICAVTDGTDKAYLYEDGTRKVILQFTCKCLQCCSFKNSDGSFFLFSLTDGSIVCYKVATAPAEHDKRKKKKKKKKSKNKEKDRVKQDCSEPTTSEPVDQLQQPDVFADLLGNDVGQETIKQEPPSGEDLITAPDLATAPGIAPITIIGEQCTVIKEENLQDFLVINNCLVTCGELEHGWTLSVYQMKTGSNLVSINGDCPSVSADVPVFEKSPIYRTYFPKADVSQRADLIGSLSYLDFLSNQSEKQSSNNQKPVIRCIISKTTQMKPQVGSTQNKVLVLEDVLYNELFGSGSNLLDSPVIVAGLPDGRIYQVVLKSLRNQVEGEQQRLSSKFKSRSSTYGEADGEGQQLASNFKSVSSASVGFTGNIFYHLKETVVDIHALHDTNHGDAKYGSKCLILLGSQGKAVIITCNEQETNKQLHYSEHCVSGPVVSSCSTASHVVYCSQRALYAFSVKCRGDDGSASTTRDHCAIMTSSLGVGRVCALAVLKSAVTVDSGEIHMELMAALANGKLVLLNFPLNDSHGNQSEPITAAAAGQRMKELLQAINNVSIRMNQLSVISSNQDKVLEELGKACHLAGLLHGSHVVSHDASVFKTQVQCVFQDEGNQCHVSLECRVTNNTTFLLSHGWSLVLCVEGRTDWPTEGDKWGSCNQLTKTVQLRDFGQGKITIVCVKLDSTRVPLRLPFHLKWHLYFSLDDFIAHITQRQVMSDVVTSKMELKESGVLLTFASNTVDMLMALRPDRTSLSRLHQGDADFVQTTCNTGFDWLSKSFGAMSSGRLRANKNSSDERSRSNGPVSTMVPFKEEIVEAMKKEIDVDKDSSNSEVLVLRWLFRYNPILLTVLTGNQLNTVTTGGMRVSFVAVLKDNVAKREKGRDVELTITAPDYETVCQLQQAVHRRLKDVLKRCDQHSVMVSKSQLQKQLRHIQELQRRLETVEDGLVSSQSLGRSQSSLLETGQAALEVYQLMRNTHSTLL